MPDVFLQSLDGQPFDGFDPFALVPELSTAGAATTSLRALVHTLLFTDRRAEPGDALPDEDRGGWWADTFGDRPLGSRIWLLRRASVGTETLAAAKTWAEEALVAMVADGLCKAVRVAVERLNRHAIGLHVTLVRGDPVADGLRYAQLWEGDL